MIKETKTRIMCIVYVHVHGMTEDTSAKEASSARILYKGKLESMYLDISFCYLVVFV